MSGEAYIMGGWGTRCSSCGELYDDGHLPDCPMVTGKQKNAPTQGPTRATTLPETPAERKTFPVASGVLDYFPDALVAISNVSWAGNNQHNPGEPLHWAREKSTDEADTLIRHFLQRGSLDTDGLRHTAKMAWRALALLQKEVEDESEE